MIARTLIVATILTAPAAAFAQAETQDKHSLADPANIARAVGPATLDRSFSMSGAQISADAKGKSATVKAEQVLSRRGGTHSVSVTGTIPFDDDDELGIAPLDSFTSGSSIKLEYTLTSLVGSIGTNGAAKLALCDQIAKAKKIEVEECDSQWIDENAPERAREFELLGFKPSAYAWSVAPYVKIGHKSMEYLNQAAFKKVEETETPWAVGAAFSYQPLVKRRLYLIKYERQKDYKDQDERTVCPAPTGSPVACLTGALGPAKHNDKDLVTGEFRQLWGDRYGLSVAVTYDFGSEDFGVDAPLYFIGGDDFAAGLKFSYIKKKEATDGDDDDLTLGVFVAKKLQLY